VNADTLGRQAEDSRLARRKINALFVCSRNQWRSPTAEHIWRDSSDINVRARGLSSKAKRVLVDTDVAWADVIFVMERRHRSLLLSRFDNVVDRSRVHVLDIPDEYRFLDPELVDQLHARAGGILNGMLEEESAGNSAETRGGADSYEVSFEQVDFRTRVLVYQDETGMARAFFEQSAVSEYDWVGAEPDFGVSDERLQQILPRIHHWASGAGLRLKIGRPHELGI
jgi:predicted protein tyrosine phosphatase